MQKIDMSKTGTIDSDVLAKLKGGRKSKQHTFNQVVDHLREQGHKALDDDYECAYRKETEDGTILRCAAGCLVPDSIYDPEMEGGRVHSLDIYRDGMFFLGHDIELVSMLQLVHDNHLVSEWEKGFESVAHIFHLHYKEPVNEEPH